jgi:Fe2+ or Zn2+ uptake regulation protein
MIKKDCYVVECDKCGELLCIHDSVEWSCFGDEMAAAEGIDIAEWKILENGIVYCDNCL